MFLAWATSTACTACIIGRQGHQRGERATRGDSKRRKFTQPCLRNDGVGAALRTPIRKPRPHTTVRHAQVPSSLLANVALFGKRRVEAATRAFAVMQCEFLRARLQTVLDEQTRQLQKAARDLRAQVRLEARRRGEFEGERKVDLRTLFDVSAHLSAGARGRGSTLRGGEGQHTSMQFRLPDRIFVRFRTVRCAHLCLRSVGKRAGRSELDALLAPLVPTGRKECPARRTARPDTPTGFRVAPEAAFVPAVSRDSAEFISAPMHA